MGCPAAVSWGCGGVCVGGGGGGGARRFLGVPWLSSNV